MGKVRSILFFDNGNVAVFDHNGHQIPELQEGWLNWKQIKKLAKIIAHNDVEVTGSCPHLNDYVAHYEKLAPQ